MVSDLGFFFFQTPTDCEVFHQSTRRQAAGQTVRSGCLFVYLSNKLRDGCVALAAVHRAERFTLGLCKVWCRAKRKKCSQTILDCVNCQKLLFHTYTENKHGWGCKFNPDNIHHTLMSRCSITGSCVGLTALQTSLVSGLFSDIFLDRFTGIQFPIQGKGPGFFQYAQKKAPSTLFRIHELTNAHDWRLYMWLTWRPNPWSWTATSCRPCPL